MLQIVATEVDTVEKGSSRATVTIDLIDTNDNFPQWTNDSYTASVFENSENGEFVIEVEVCNPQACNFSSVLFFKIMK